MQNGSMKLEPLSASLVRSITAVTAQASVATVTSASPSMTADVRMGISVAPPTTQASPNQAVSAQLPSYERGVRYFSLTESGEKPTPDVHPANRRTARAGRLGAPQCDFPFAHTCAQTHTPSRQGRRRAERPAGEGERELPLARRPSAGKRKR
ncbi:hypothetical protein M9458_004669, partial [Cirrhinus mrigala]